MTALPWRARIGLVIPQFDCLSEPLLPPLLPAGVSLHVSRLPRTGPVTAETIRQMNAAVDAAVDLLPISMLDLVVFHCTTGSLLYPPESLTEHLESRTGLPVVTTAGAVVMALRALGAARLSLVTPYNAELNRLETAFLEKAGISVKAIGGSQLEDSELMQSVSAEDVALWARRAGAPGTADATFISCTGIRSLNFIPELEADLGRPVVTSTTAMLWHVYTRLAVGERPARLGRLMEVMP